MALTGIPGDTGAGWKAAIGYHREGGGKIAMAANSIAKISVCRPGQPKVFPEGAALIVRSEYPSPLQFRHHLIYEIIQAAGQIWKHDVKSVASVGHQPLTAAELLTTVDAAISRLGQSGFDTDLFSNVAWAIADLSGTTLGLATPATVTIDADAAGYGWYIDATPQNDAEFAPSADRLGTAAEIDLLTVVMHELGHVAGLDDLYDADDSDELMYAWLQPGMRRTSTLAAIADKAFAEL